MADTEQKRGSAPAPGSWRTAAMLGSMFGVVVGTACPKPETVDSCAEAVCSPAQICDQNDEGFFCNCEVGTNGATCSRNTDCGGLAATMICDPETCSCVDPGATGESTGDPTSPTSSSPTDPSTTDPGTTDPGTTDPGTTDPGTTDPGSTGGGGDGLRYVCVTDISSVDVEPNGVATDAIQVYTGDLDLYAGTTTCSFGPNPDPAHMDCDMVAGTKDFCVGDTGYASLGGPGGWVCGQFEEPIQNGHIVTAQLCGSPDPTALVEISLCSEADPTSSSCVPCPINLNSSCEVSGL